jgi:predicted nuclease of predicted toxin-antitoxin system
MARLLFDEPLSEKLCDMLADVFPAPFTSGSLVMVALRRHGLGVARSHDCLVVSKDEDFNRLAILRGAPPKFVWVRRGNCATREIATLLRQRHQEIVRFERARGGDRFWN